MLLAMNTLVYQAVYPNISSNIMYYTPHQLTLQSGVTYNTRLTIRQADGTVSSIHGYTVSASLKRYFGSSESFPISASIFNESAGLIDITVSGVSSDTMMPGRYYYSVAATGSNSVVTLFEGEMEVTE